MPGVDQIASAAALDTAVITLRNQSFRPVSTCLLDLRTRLLQRQSGVTSGTLTALSPDGKFYFVCNGSALVRWALRDGKLVDATWDEAMQMVAQRFADDIRNHGPDSVAYYGSGQCLSEES